MEPINNIPQPIEWTAVSAMPNANNIVFKNNAITKSSFLLITLQLNILNNLQEQLTKLL